MTEKQRSLKAGFSEVLNIHYFTDRQQPLKSEFPHLSLFFRHERNPFWQGAGQGRIGAANLLPYI